MALAKVVWVGESHELGERRYWGHSQLVFHVKVLYWSMIGL